MVKQKSILLKINSVQSLHDYLQCLDMQVRILPSSHRLFHARSHDFLNVRRFWLSVCVPPVCCVACQLGIWSTFPPFRCPRWHSFLFSLSSLGFDAAAVLVGLRCVLFGEQHYQRCKDAHLGLNEACLSLSVPSLRLSLQPKYSG